MEGIPIDRPFTRWLKSHELTAFFVLAFLLTFAGWVPLFLGLPGSDLFNILGLWGPALAAVILTAATRRRAGLAELFRKVLHWRVPVRWYLIIFLGWPALSLLAAVIHARITGQALVFQWDQWAGFTAWLVQAVILGFWACEEIGWRGFALPRLLERWNALTASIILGLLWALWHLPYYLLGAQMVSFPIFALNTVALSILMTWVLAHTRGSVFLAVFFHFWFNVYSGLQADKLPLLNTVGLENVQDVLLAVAALSVVVVYGYRTLTRDLPDQTTREEIGSKA